VYVLVVPSVLEVLDVWRVYVLRVRRKLNTCRVPVLASHGGNVVAGAAAGVWYVLVVQVMRVVNPVWGLRFSLRILLLGGSHFACLAGGGLA
jgi:hypothetical protein